MHRAIGGGAANQGAIANHRRTGGKFVEVVIRAVGEFVVVHRLIDVENVEVDLGDVTRAPLQGRGNAHALAVLQFEGRANAAGCDDGAGINCAIAVSIYAGGLSPAKVERAILTHTALGVSGGNQRAKGVVAVAPTRQTGQTRVGFVG